MERNFSITADTGKKKVRMTMHVPPAYPKDHIFCFNDDGEYENITDALNEKFKSIKTVQQAVEVLTKELHAKFDLKSKSNQNDSEPEDEDEEFEEDDEVHDESDIDQDEGPDLRSSALIDVAEQENKRLRADFDEALEAIGANTMKYLPDLNMVRFFIDMSYLGEAMSGALGIHFGTPIQVTLVFTEDYLDAPWLPQSSPVKIEIDQKPHNDSFALQFQISEIAKKWLEKNWKQYKEKKGTAFKSQGSPAKNPLTKYDKQIAELTDMGFPLKQIKYALYKFNGDQSQALTALLEPDSKFTKEANEFNENNLMQSVPASTSNSNANDVNIQSGRNFLIDLYMYIVQRITNCSNFCPICDARHEMDGIKPIVCSKKDCKWRYEELGLGANIQAELKHNNDVVDMLISCCYSALVSGRGEKIFVDSFPSDFMNSNNTKNFTKMQQLLEKFPTVKELMETEARQTLDKIDVTAFRLLRWLITSNRAHLVKLSEDKHIKEMGTPHQYIMLTSTPEKEAKFNELKEKHGSFLAFHGSPMENWHAILRSGLKNLSNKEGYMLHGAAHGAGIYLAPVSGTSSSYMRQGTGWAKSQFGSTCACIALCEVIDHSSVKGRNHNEWCYVVDNEDYVNTRFFFIYNSPSSMPANVTARTLKVPDAAQFGFQNPALNKDKKKG
eukprot:CAMPEP_0168564570 /NCGR_PEP_ID=MMETSP0413-20121227/13323_1 /TAXON_ID=136452 /ORGANISM="Filamoeba nolandi, Strain NC-AS-23-1" /LENGTH=668 /DNA_ID=CAMNT_0008596265 /DNA_START=26 /DNA_END=2029 /DNA_ORIENTATION=+